MDYHGIDIAIASRIMNTADGGQINISDVVYEMISLALDNGFAQSANTSANQSQQQQLPPITIHNLGHQPIKGLDSTINVHAVYPRALSERFYVRTRPMDKNALDSLDPLSIDVSETRPIPHRHPSVTVSDFLNDGGSSTDTENYRRLSYSFMAANTEPIKFTENPPSSLGTTSSNASRLSVSSIPEQDEDDQHNFSDVE